MGRFRTALATIGVGAAIALQGPPAQAASPTDDPGTTSTPLTPTPDVAVPTGSTGATGPDASGDIVAPPDTGGATGGSGPSKPQGGNGTGGTKPSKGNGTKPGSGSKGDGSGKAPVIKAEEPDFDGSSGSIQPEPTINPDPLNTFTPGTPAVACDGSPGAPSNLIPIYQEASEKYGLGDRGPAILAAINKIETDFGRLNEVTSYAGAIGWMQFMPATWASYGVDANGDGKADPYDPVDAIHAAAGYLAAAGAPEDWYSAIWAYNHADWYVADVLAKAGCYGAMVAPAETDSMRDVFTCEPSDRRKKEIPENYLRSFERAASQYDLGKKGVWALAAVARLESDYGRGMTAKQLERTGPMGMVASDWKAYGVDGNGDGRILRHSPGDAVSSLARMIWSKGSLRAGLFAHNHASWYVEAVMAEAERIGGNCEVDQERWTIALPGSVVTDEINFDNLTIANAAAQNDIADGLLDDRVIKVLALLTQRHEIVVTALRSDHSMLTASGNISNHYAGRAMDIAMVDGVSCTDMSYDSPCSTVGRMLTMLPDSIRPTELIYGYDLDGPGPAFALADHRDHLHVGWYAD